MTFREWLDQVRAASPIREVVADVVTLQGNQGLCPFHKETGPSFSVSPERGTFRCFGASCGASGDVFAFVELLERVEFREAALKLAERAGLPPHYPSKADEEVYVSLREIEEVTDLAATHYVQALTPAVREYVIENRRLPERFLEEYRIGWADGSLTASLVARGGDPVARVLVKAGLARVSQETVGTPWVDYFDQRVMLAATRGGLATFLSGRAFSPDQTPKYLHQTGREAPLFNEDALAESALFVTEGPFDALSLLAWEFPAVAFFGGMRPSSVAKLKRVKGQLYVATDADAGGRGAALKMALALGPTLRVIEFPEGMDPNDFYRKSPRRAFERLIREAPEVAVWLQRPAEAPGLSGIEQIERLTSYWAFLATLTPALGEAYLADSKQRFGWSTAMATAARRTVEQHRVGARVACPACGTAVVVKG
jgi:DNA primase